MLFAASGLAKAQTTAVNLAQQKLEELRMIDYELIKGDADMPASHKIGDNASYVRRMGGDGAWPPTTRGCRSRRVANPRRGNRDR
jgi:hypothetical protein